MKAPTIMKKIICTNLLIAFLAFQGTLLFAATPSTTATQCDTSTIERKVNTCPPEVTLNIASTSSVFTAISNSPVQSSIVSSIFDTSVPVAKILNSNSASHVSFYGQSRGGLFSKGPKRVLVNITNWTNSSSVGISQLLTSQFIAIAGYAENAFYVYTKPSATQSGCATVDSTNPLAPVLNCPITSVSYKPNFVISDVEPSEYQALNNPVSGTLGKLSLIRSAPTFLQGFGIAVNDSFYRALQGQNIRDGVLPSSCTVGDMTGACQPSIKQAQLSSLYSTEGKVKAVSDLISGDTTPLTLNQAELTHATKAAQNMLLLNNSCGLPANKTKSNAALNPLGASNGSAKLQITETYKTNDAIALAITSGGGYQMGLLPLSINAQFIKLDASSPNFDINGQAAYQNRTQTANGLNPLATMTYTVRMVKEDVSVKAVADAFWLALQSSAWSDIAGLAYLDGAQDNSSVPQQANVQRLKNTNCSPLINYKNTSVTNTPSLPLNPIQITPATTPSAPTSSPTSTPTSTYFIGGIVSGLSNGQNLTLINNSNDSITVSANGNFVFNKNLPTNSNYAVALSSNPSGYNCNVQNGSGKVSNSNINNISVVCSALLDIFYNSSNGSYYRYVKATGITWQQAKEAAEQSSYNGMQGYLATVTTLQERNFIDQTVFSGTKPGNVFVGGSDAYQEGVWRWVTGPEGLQDGGKGMIFYDGTSRTDIPTNDLWINQGNISSTPHDSGSSHYLLMYSWFNPRFNPWIYSLGTPDQGGASGYLVEYSASYRPIYVSGTLSGLDAGQTITLSNNVDDSILVSANGAFNFTKPIQAGTTYSVSIRKDNMPNFKKCIVSNGSGVVVSNVTNVTVECLTPIVSTLAGMAGWAGSYNGTGTAANFRNPEGIAVDYLQNIYVADTGNNLIRKITPAGIVSTIAGNGDWEDKDGKGISASFASPRAIVVDLNGDIYVATNRASQGKIRKISPDGTVTTIAEDTSVVSIALDSNRTIYAGSNRQYIYKFKSTSSGYTRDVLENPYFPEPYSIRDYYGKGSIASDPIGNIFVVSNKGIKRISSDGAIFSTPWDGAFANFSIDSSGNLYTTDYGNITKIDLNGARNIISNPNGVPGSQDGIGKNASFSGPRGVAVDSLGNVYVADTDNQIIRKITFVKP